MNYKKDICVFFGIYAFMAFIAIVFLIFPDFDWLNYRMYNCWAFLTDRMSVDFLAGNFRTCFNPIIDLPEYLLLWKLNNHPYLYNIICLFDSVCLLFLVYKFSCLLFNCRGFYSKSFPVAYIAVSPVMMLQMSFDQNDIKIALLLFIAFYIFIKNIFLPFAKKRNFLIFLAGIIVGIAMGLKLTAFVFLLSFLLITLFLFKKIDKPFLTVGIFCLGVIPAFLAIDGYWLYKCYKVYHNPFFPYFNDIFKSEYAAFDRLLNQDYRHLAPINWQEFVFYPFFQCVGTRLYGTDNFSWDVRYAVNFVVVVILSVGLFAAKSNTALKNYMQKIVNLDYLLFMLLFSIVPFYVNLVFFGTYRYIIAASSLYGIILFVFILLLCEKCSNPKKFTAILSILFIVYSYTSSRIGDVEYIKKFEENKDSVYKQVLTLPDLHFEDNSVVILVNALTSVAVVNQNPNVKYIGYSLPQETIEKERKVLEIVDPCYETKNLRSDYLQKMLADEINSDKKLYILYVTSNEFRIANESLFMLDKNYKRELENCAYTGMKTYNSVFWGTDIWKCEYNIVR